MMPTPNRAAAKQARLRTALTGEPHTAALAAITGHPDPLPDGAHFAHATRDGHDANNPSVQWVDTATCTPLGVSARDVRPITVPLMSGQQPYRPGDMLLEIAPTDDGDLWYARNVHNPRHLAPHAAEHEEKRKTWFGRDEKFPRNPRAWAERAAAGEVAFGFTAEGYDAFLPFGKRALFILGDAGTAVTGMVDTLITAALACPRAYEVDIVSPLVDPASAEQLGITVCSGGPDDLDQYLTDVENDIRRRRNLRAGPRVPGMHRRGSDLLDAEPRRVIFFQDVAHIITNGAPKEGRTALADRLVDLAVRGSDGNVFPVFSAVGADQVLHDDHLMRLFNMGSLWVGKVTTVDGEPHPLTRWFHPTDADPNDPRTVYYLPTRGGPTHARYVPIDNTALDALVAAGSPRHPYRDPEPGARIMIDFMGDAGGLASRLNTWAWTHGRTFQHFTLTGNIPASPSKETYDPLADVDADWVLRQIRAASWCCRGGRATGDDIAWRYVTAGWELAQEAGIIGDQDPFAFIIELLHGSLARELTARFRTDCPIPSVAHALDTLERLEPQMAHDGPAMVTLPQVSTYATDPRVAAFAKAGGRYAIRSSEVIARQNVCLLTLPANRELDDAESLLGVLAILDFQQARSRARRQAGVEATLTIRGRSGTETVLALADDRIDDPEALRAIIQG